LNAFLAAWLPTLVLAAGLGQLALIVASLAIPRALRWPEEMAKLRPLTRQVFWTYAGYIWVTNLSFGLLSTFAPDSLLNRSPLAAAVSAFMGLYWAARLVIQFAYFDRRDAPRGTIFRLAEAALVGLFIYLACVYGTAFAFNLGVVS
jgi:hypothetical protein